MASDYAPFCVVKSLLMFFLYDFFRFFLVAQWASCPPVDRPSGLDPGCSAGVSSAPSVFVHSVQVWPPFGAGPCCL